MRGIAVATACMGSAAVASAQLLAAFEPPAYVGIPTGVPLSGQAGWYVVNLAADGRVHRYDGNTLGIVSNPTGGTQFAGLRGEGFMVARADHDVLNFLSGGVWTASYDVCFDRFGGALPGADYLGHFSLQPSTFFRYWQTLFRWDDPAAGNAVDVVYRFFDSAGVMMPLTVPGAAWDALALNTWYRQSTTWDFDTNRILSVSIDNLHDATPPTTVDVSGLGWYLAGGASTTLPLATSVRLTSSGAPANWNIAAWDNLVVIPAPSAAALLLLSVVAFRGARRTGPCRKHTLSPVLSSCPS